MYLGYFEVEANDPLDEPGQRALIRQIGAKGRRTHPPDDFAVVEFCTHGRTRLARKGDLVHSHQDYPPSACWFRCVVSLPGALGRVLTLFRVIPPRIDGQGACTLRVARCEHRCGRDRRGASGSTGCASWTRRTVRAGKVPPAATARNTGAQTGAA